MEIRTLVVAFVAIFNFAATTLEKLLSGDGSTSDVPTTRRSRSTSSRSRSSSSKAVDDEDTVEDDNDNTDDDTPSEDDIIDAVKAAQKILEKTDISKILMKYGKASRATEVAAANRQRVIDALEKAIDDAE